MPTVYLKEKSPEFDQEDHTHSEIKICEADGCRDFGEYKAPKHRGLNDYYHFCLDHVREYNQQWDFFDGMNEEEVQDHILKSSTGFRPTWNFSNSVFTEEDLRNRVFQDFFFEQAGEGETRQERQENARALQNGTPEFEAMAVIGVEPPLDWNEIRTQYKKLVKKFHPDTNGGSKEAEEQLKKINMAYTVLKLAFEKYKTIEEKPA